MLPLFLCIPDTRPSHQIPAGPEQSIADSRAPEAVREGDVGPDVVLAVRTVVKQPIHEVTKPWLFTWLSRVALVVGCWLFCCALERRQRKSDTFGGEGRTLLGSESIAENLRYWHADSWVAEASVAQCKFSIASTQVCVRGFRSVMI